MLKAFYAFLLFLTLTTPVLAQQGNKWGDQRDGAYANPILPGDFPDGDVTRVGADYYYLTATKGLSPGMMILTSKDLVNWRIVGHAVNDLTQISPKYNFDHIEGAGRGTWAGAIRYHDNKFYVYFTDPDEGIFVTSAAKITGPWKPLIRLMNAPGWDDPCPFWEDNGQAYLMATHSTDNYKTHLFKMDGEGERILTEADQVIRQGKASEANKLYKINNYYYHFYNEITPEGRVPFMERSVSIVGPYTEHRQLIHKADHEPNQGGLIQTEKGDWYVLTHHDMPRWDGRELSLLPVTWDKGWPVWGTVGKDGIGSMVWGGKKPATAAINEPIQTSDDFGGKTLSPQWEWYFQPNNDKWSLTERPGYLRLYSSKALEPGVIAKTPNVLTQRPLRLQHSIATVKFDMAHMTDGQTAAFGLFGKATATIGVTQSGKSRRLYFNAAGKTTQGQEIEIANVWLRATWDANGLAHFLYSTDGVNYDEFGNAFTINNFNDTSGARLAIYTVDENAGTGFLDVDWFHYNVEN